MERYVVFDVETPNYANDRMSAIGIAVVENREVTQEIYSLIDPEEEFSYFNSMLTGITGEMVAGQPTFPELWVQWGHLFDDSILVAHNAPFDMRVLAKCLKGYGIKWKPMAKYMCTCAVGRDCYPELDNHKLNTMCDYLGIDLCHHQASSDSRACAGLLINYLDKGAVSDWYIREYDMVNMRTLPRGKGKRK